MSQLFIKFFPKCCIVYNNWLSAIQFSQTEIKFFYSITLNQKLVLMFKIKKTDYLSTNKCFVDLNLKPPIHQRSQITRLNVFSVKQTGRSAKEYANTTMLIFSPLTVNCVSCLEVLNGFRLITKLTRAVVTCRVGQAFAAIHFQSQPITHNSLVPKHRVKVPHTLLQ